MAQTLILASSSAIRQTLLNNARVPFDVHPGRIDEVAIRAALAEDGASPRDVADTLAELKAKKISNKHPDALVIGCDQVLDFDGCIIGKPASPDALANQLRQMRGKRHMLLSAVVVYEADKPVWRHVGQVRLTMHMLSDSFINGYVDRNWEQVKTSAGGYLLEEEGVRLFSVISGDYFTVLGLPLVELLSYLALRGVIEQ